MPSLHLATKGVCSHLHEDFGLGLATKGISYFKNEIIDFVRYVPYFIMPTGSYHYYYRINGVGSKPIIKYQTNVGTPIPYPDIGNKGEPIDNLPPVNSVGGSTYPPEIYVVGEPTTTPLEHNVGKNVLGVFRNKRKVFKFVL